MSYWTTEQVADYLDITEQAVYDSKRRGKFPGNRGKRRGRRLMFDSEAIEAGAQVIADGLDPDTPETTNDPTEALLWALEGIHKTLRAIHNELRAQRLQYLELETIETTVEIEGDDEE